LVCDLPFPCFADDCCVSQLDFEDEPDDGDEEEDASEAGSQEERDRDSESEEECFEDAMENLKISEAPQTASVAA